MGHVISKDGLSPSSGRVDRAIEDFPVPNSKKELRRFLGLVGWFRKYIFAFADIADPLNFLLRNSVCFQWRKEHQMAFEYLKSQLTRAPILAYPRFDLPFRIAVDTSSRGIGYMLYQMHPTADTKDEVRVIRFGSKGLSKYQRSYGPTKLELLGMTYAVLECASYVRGTHFVIKCDHQALKPLYQKQLKGAIYERWLAILQEFTFDIQYKPAKEICVPDALSRNLPRNCDDDVDSPDADDQSFPYVNERSGQILLPDGQSLPSCFQSPVEEINRIALVTPQLDGDLGYDADTNEHLDIPSKEQRRTRKIVKRTLTPKMRSPATYVKNPNACAGFVCNSDSDTKEGDKPIVISDTYAHAVPVCDSENDTNRVSCPLVSESDNDTKSCDNIVRPSISDCNIRSNGVDNGSSDTTVSTRNENSPDSDVALGADSEHSNDSETKHTVSSVGDSEPNQTVSSASDRDTTVISDTNTRPTSHIEDTVHSDSSVDNCNTDASSR